MMAQDNGTRSNRLDVPRSAAKQSVLSEAKSLDEQTPYSGPGCNWNSLFQYRGVCGQIRQPRAGCTEEP